MAARTVLLKLEQRGWVRLPARRIASPNRHRLTEPAPRDWDQRSIRRPLAELSPVGIEEVSEARGAREELRALLARFHDLGYPAPAGENLQYVVRDRAVRLLAGEVFAGAAWKCAARDQRIGWHRRQREARLNRIANNVRFLLPPWVQVPHLESWILGALGRRIAGDWQAKYGHPVVLLETFVERDRFAGTCYRAANWVRVGETTGRSRAPSSRPWPLRHTRPDARGGSLPGSRGTARRATPEAAGARRFRSGRAPADGWCRGCGWMPLEPPIRFRPCFNGLAPEWPLTIRRSRG